MKAALKPELKLGADRKRLALLGGLLVVGVIVYFINRTDTPSSGSATTAPVAVAPVAIPASSVRVPVRTAPRSIATRGGRGEKVMEFHPTLHPKDPIDAAHVDPTLQLGLLAKLREVKPPSTARSLFEASTAPLQPIATVKKIIPGPLQMAMTVGPSKPPPPAPKVDPVKPPPPPIPLKFYGYANSAQSAGVRRAFFLEGDDIFVAGEGELIKNRYRVVKIGVNSAIMEDTENKNQQTLPLVEEMQNS